MAHFNIIQWNCRGLRSNFNELQLLHQDFKPSAFCLQETFLKETDKFGLRGYDHYHSYSPQENKATGGSSVLVRQGIIHSRVPIDTALQAVAVRLTLHIVLTICSIYIPPTSNLRQTDLQNLYDQLPKPCILVGDFNGHNPLWGSSSLSKRGELLENFISINDLCLLNDGSTTYLHPATGTYSALDLSVCSADVLQEFDWSVHDDLCGSDHFPTVLSAVSPADRVPSSRWNFSKADWSTFTTLCESHITSELLSNVIDPIQTFTDKLIEIATVAIPKSSARPHIRKP